MSSVVTTPVTVVPKVGWFKKLEGDVLKVLGIAGSAEKVAEPFVEALLPQSAPIFGILDQIFPEVAIIQQTFAAVGQANNNQAKLQAALTGVEASIDQWVSANLPGSAEIKNLDSYIQARTAAATAYVNATVAFANALPANSATAVTAPGVAAASAAVAAVAASK
jgi:hypothetical protein